MLALDARITRAANGLGFTFTRYADDLHFSTSAPGVGRREAQHLLRVVTGMLQSESLSVNQAKTGIAGPGARRVVLGLLVDQDTPRLTRRFRNKVQQHLYFLEKHGGPAHAEKRGFETVTGLKLHLYGISNYISQVEPDFGAKVRERLLNAAW